MSLHQLCLFLLLPSAIGFAPQAFLSKATGTTSSAILAPLISKPMDIAAVSSLHRDASSLLVADDGGIIDIVRNIAIGVTAILFLFAGLTMVTAAIIIPAAAKELEKECKELAPELWDEYQLKLEPGQTISQRPELMQELRAKLQPLLDAKIERKFADAKSKGIDVSEDEKAWRAIDDTSKRVPKVAPPPESPPSVMQSQWDDDESAIDVEIISKKEQGDDEK